MTVMARRLLTFAVAFVVIGAPVAADLCQATCATHGERSRQSIAAGAHHHHADRESAPPGHHHSAPALSQTPPHGAMSLVERTCGHTDAILTEARETARVSVADVTPAPSGVLFNQVLATPPTDVVSRHGPPGLLRDTPPLRL